jgi:hypothetical protein
VAIARNRRRPTRYLRTASRRRSSSLKCRWRPLSWRRRRRFSSIRLHLPLLAIQPAGEDGEQQPERGGVDHGPESISRAITSCHFAPPGRRSSRGTLRGPAAKHARPPGNPEAASARHSGGGRPAYAGSRTCVGAAQDAGTKTRRFANQVASLSAHRVFGLTPSVPRVSSRSSRLAQPRAHLSSAASPHPRERAVSISPGRLGGPTLASNPGSILASAEARGRRGEESASCSYSGREERRASTIRSKWLARTIISTEVTVSRQRAIRCRLGSRIPLCGCPRSCSPHSYGCEQTANPNLQVDLGVETSIHAAERWG